MTTKHLLFCILTVTACQGSDKKPAAPANQAESAAPAAPTPPAALTAPDPAALAAPAPKTFTVVFLTSEGEIEIAVDRSLAPRGADRLYYLASNGFFTGARFFRVVRGFMAQFGLSGIPAVDAAFETLSIKDEPRRMSNEKGTLAFAKSPEPNSRSTQMFINLVDNGPMLDEQGFAPVGRVVRGMDVAEKLFSTYAEMSNQQGLIMSRGNPWLQTRYPELDSIVTATVKP